MPVGRGTLASAEHSGLQDDAAALPAAFNKLVCLGRFDERDSLGDA